MDKKTIGIVSGGFDPIHPGHIMMMKDCLKFSNWCRVNGLSCSLAVAR